MKSERDLRRERDQRIDGSWGDPVVVHGALRRRTRFPGTEQPGRGRVEGPTLASDGSTTGDPIERPPGPSVFEATVRSAASCEWVRRLLSRSPACRRRQRALGPVACAILLGRSDARPLTPAAWLSLVALGALFAQSADLGWLLAPSLCLFAGLSLIALFDARYFVIPDGPLLCLVLFSLATALITEPEDVAARLAAGALGFVALRAVAFVYETLRGAPGVGEGDARLFAVAGLWLGFPGLPSCLIYAVLSALLSAVVALRQGTLENARAPMPFGPHLALGLWLAWVFGPLEFG